MNGEQTQVEHKSTDPVNLPPLRMNAYYFGFTETGVRCVDEILSAVACAGKGYHHTDGWAEGGYVDQIQAAAGRAAALFAAAPDLLTSLQELVAWQAEVKHAVPLIYLERARAAIAKATGEHS